MIELLDIYDENMVYIGQEKREIVHKNGLWHKTFQCWIYSLENGESYLLFQHRHPEKDTFPNRFDISSAGHLVAGETIEDGVRELKEELGISVEISQLREVGIIPRSIKTSYHNDNEFCCVYLYESNKPLNAYRLQREEVTGLYKVKVQDFYNLIKSSGNDRETMRIKAFGVELSQSGELIEETRQLGIDDFVPHGEKYYMTLLNNLLRSFS